MAEASTFVHDQRKQCAPWSAKEDVIVVSAVRKWGSNWPRLTTLLPGRTPDAVRNRHHRMQQLYSSEELDQWNDDNHFPPEESATEEDGPQRESLRFSWTAEDEALIEEGGAALRPPVAIDCRPTSWTLRFVDTQSLEPNSERQARQELWWRGSRGR